MSSALLLIASASAFVAPLHQNNRLIETAPYTSRWMTESEVLSLIEKDIPFMDVTDYPDLGIE